MAAGVAGNGAPGQRSAGPNALGAITAIPFTGLIDANCRFTVYSRSSTNGPVRSYISNFVLEVKLLLFQPWPPPTSARRLLVLRHGPSARLQGVAIVAGYEPPVQRSAYGRRDPRFDFCRHDPRFCWTLLREGLDCLHFTESPGNGHSRPGRWHSFSSPTHALARAHPGPLRAHCTHTAYGLSRTCAPCPRALSRLHPEYSVPK